jgi:hypothetical protein
MWGISRQVLNNLFYENELPLVNGIGSGLAAWQIGG